MADIAITEPGNSGALSANQVYDVSVYERFTVFAASATTVALSADGGTTWSATVAVPAGGYLTITDLASRVKANAAYRVIGLLRRP